MTVILVMTCVTAIAYGLSFWYDKIYKRKFVEVEARVCGMDSYMSKAGRAGSKREVFQPEFEYEWNGWKRRVTPRAYTTFWNYKPGQTVKLLIDPNDVDNFRIHDFDRKMIWWAWSIVMAFLFVGIFR